MPFLYTILTYLCTLLSLLLLRRRASRVRPAGAPEESEADGSLPSASARHPRSEIVLLVLLPVISAAAVLIVVLRHPDLSVLHFLCILVTLCVLAAAVCTDVYAHRILNLFPIILCCARGAALLWEWADGRSFPGESLLVSCIGAAIIFAFLWAVSALTHGGIGAGDIKLMAALSFLCGFVTAVCTLLAAMTFCAVFAVVLLIIRRKKLKDFIAMGPFFFAGFVVTIMLTAA